MKEVYIEGKLAVELERYGIFITEQGNVYRHNGLVNGYRELELNTYGHGPVVPLFDKVTKKTTTKTLLSLMSLAYFDLKPNQKVRKVVQDGGYGLDNLGIYEGNLKISGQGVVRYSRGRFYDLEQPLETFEVNHLLDEYNSKSPLGHAIRLDKPYDQYQLYENGKVTNITSGHIKSASFDRYNGYYIALYDQLLQKSIPVSLIELVCSTYMHGIPPNYRVHFNKTPLDPSIHNIILVDPTGDKYDYVNFSDLNVTWYSYNDIQISNLMHVKRGEDYLVVTRHPKLYHKYVVDYNGVSYPIETLYQKALDEFAINA